MSNRTLPYGYKIQGGILAAAEPEAEIVKEIYSERAKGETLSKIADWLNLRSIPFFKDASWDKHKVKRVLENDRYIGKDGYPLILSENEVKLARSYQYREKSESVCPEAVGRLKKFMVCEGCGTKIRRVYVKRRKNNPVGWECEACGTKLLLPDHELLNIILKSHRRLKERLLEHKSNSPFNIPQTPESRMLENKISALLGNADRDSNEVYKLIMQWTAQRYEDAKNDMQDHTQRVKRLLEEDALDRYDETLTESIVSRIVLNAPCTITVRYINGMKITTGKEKKDGSIG